MGLIASTDDHNGTPGQVAEDAYPGHTGRNDDSAEKRVTKFPEFNPGGLAGVWAEENTRASVFSALYNRETFGTSGPRIRVRFYQTKAAAPCTADFPKTIIDAGDAMAMGSVIGPSVLGGQPPPFAIAALPDGNDQPLANGTSGPAGLDRVQIIKAHYKAGQGNVIYDKPVDVAIASGGACVPWTDPAPFDPQAYAFYYVRVMQAKTLRWSHFDCASNPTVADCANGTLDTPIQERAWSSPIWYQP